MLPYRCIKKLLPEKLVTRMENFLKKHDIVYMIFAPPHCSALQPIELLWPHGKNCVVRTSHLGRAMRRNSGILKRGADCERLIEHYLG